MELTQHQEERLNTIEETLVLYPRFNRILEKMREVHSQFGRSGMPGSMFIQGPPGSGKTSLVDAYKQRYDGPGKVVDMLVPSPADPGSVLTEMLAKVGDPLPWRGSVPERTRRVGMRFQREGVGLLIMDEIGNFMDSKSHVVLRKSADWLKNLMMRLRIPIVALGARDEMHDSSGHVLYIDAGAVIHVDRQVSDRFRFREEIRPFDWAERKEEFLGFLAQVDKALPLAERSGLAEEAIALRCFYASDGRARLLMNLIRQAAKRAVLRNQTSITHRDLAVAFEDVCRTDVLQRAKENPFEVEEYTVAEYNAARIQQQERIADTLVNGAVKKSNPRNRGRKPVTTYVPGLPGAVAS